MSERSLTEQQRRRASKAQSDKRRRAKSANRDLSAQSQSGQLGSEQSGLVVSRYSREYDVEAMEGPQSGTVHRCRSRSNLGGIVTGDEVVWRAGADNTGVIESRLPRSSILERPDNFGRIKPVAANIDQIIVVIAVQPEPQPTLIDRYLVAAELMNVRPILVLNKIDLITEDNHGSLSSLMEAYRSLGYRTVEIISSRHQIPELSHLPELVTNQTSIVVGQSGVGKSSLINTLLPEADLTVGDLSSSTGEGTHTTTRARLFHLPNGGKLIDSPGIRDFGLWHIEPAQLQYGFIEIANHVGLCRFRDCQHESEPGCAVLAAVENGEISEQRFKSFLETRQTIRDQHTRRLSSQ